MSSIPEINAIVRLLKYSFISGFIDREVDGDIVPPISIMLISSPESGKTKLLKLFEFKDYEKGKGNLCFVDQLSARPVIKKLLDDIQERKFTHIVIPDFLSVVERNPLVTSTVIDLFNKFMEEGLKKGYFNKQEYELKERVWCGLASSITTVKFDRLFPYFDSVGFSSRFIPISFEHSKSFTQKVKSKIYGLADASNDGITIEREFCDYKVRKRPVKIDLPKDMAVSLSEIVDDVVKRLNTYSVTGYLPRQGIVKVQPNIKGYRLAKLFIVLSKCIAYDKDKKSVDDECIDELRVLSSYINYPNTLKIIDDKPIEIN